MGWLSMMQVVRDVDERENLNATHLEVFKRSFHISHHDVSESRSCCKLKESVVEEIDCNSFMSSANRYVWLKVVMLGMSFTYTRNSSGPRMLP